MPTVSDEWKAQEDYTNDYFPLPGTPVARRGRFAGVVVKALGRRMISLDTAATLLNTKPEDVTANSAQVLELSGP